MWQENQAVTLPHSHYAFTSGLHPQMAKQLQPNVPFDLYLPSAQDTMKKQTCAECGLYHVSVAGLKRHVRAVHRGETDDVKEESESGEQDSDFESDNGAQQVDKTYPSW